MKREEGAGARHKLRSLRRVFEASLRESEKYMLAYCVENYLQLEADERKEYEEMLAQIEDHELPEIESYSEHVARHRREGREEGRKEAREALRRSVLKILDRKFGHVPAEVRERVDSLRSVDALDRWLTLVLEVESLEELKQDESHA